VITLPKGDADYPARWRRVKSLFTTAVAGADASARAKRRGGYAIRQRRFWRARVARMPQGLHAGYVATSGHGAARVSKEPRQ